MKVAALLVSVVAALGGLTDLQIEKVHVPENCVVKSKKGDRLNVHYTGTFTAPGQDETTFDSSRTRGRPFTFTLGVGQVIKGWDVGMDDMCEGEKRILNIPYAMAYGDRGAGGVIPARQDLKFDVELLNIVRKDEL